MNATPRTNDQQVGTVIGVSNYHVTILLGSETSSQVRVPSAHRRRYAHRGYLLFPVSSGELAVGIVVGAFEDEAIEPDVHRSMTLQLTHARRTLRANLLGQLREGSSFGAGVSVYPSPMRLRRRYSNPKTACGDDAIDSETGLCSEKYVFQCVPTLDTPALLPTEEELKKILEFQVKDADAGKTARLRSGYPRSTPARM